MKRISKIVLCACALIIVTCISAHAGAPGSSCADAIPMGKDFRAEVKNGQTVWYSAWTFDLPLTVTFAPANGKNDPAPEVEMDFTCISGYYKDSILCSLFCKTSGSSGIDMGLPHKPALKSDVKDGTFVYYLSLGKRYRDLLLQVGISYNVEVFVKVTYKSDGTIKLAPDSLFTNCVDNAKFIRYGDTVQLAANDTNRHVIFPFLQWQEDTVIYKWTGTEPCEVVVANTCDFLVYNHHDGNIIDRKPIAPGDSVKIKANVIYDYVHNKEYPNEAGMYFTRIQSNAPGVLQVLKAKQAQPDGNATMLKYDKSYPLDANSKAIYYIPRSWDKDVQFTVPTEHLFSIVFSSTADFGENDTLATYSLQKKDNGRWVGITATAMKDLWKKIPTEKLYIYIRFICTEATVVTPEKWAVSDCYTNTINNLVEPNTSLTIDYTSSKVYRFSYAQWRGGDMTIKFALNSNCEVYIADTCGMNKSKTDAPYWLLPKTILKSTSPIVIPESDIASWADRIDEEGSFYALFYTSAISTNRKLTFTTTAPKEVDPVYPTSTISVVCDGTKIMVNVSQAQTIEVYDESSVKKAEWEAEPDTPHELVLPVGKYTLAGEKEKIKINL